MFSIELESAVPPLGRGRISIGDFSESFEIVLEYWSENEYRRHWDEALYRILGGAKVDALITSMTDPRFANFFFWWPMYREDEVVIFQNAILFMDQLDAPFSLDRYYEHVLPRQEMSEDGEKISSWRLPLSDIADFMQGRRSGQAG